MTLTYGATVDEYPAAATTTTTAAANMTIPRPDMSTAQSSDEFSEQDAQHQHQNESAIQNEATPEELAAAKRARWKKISIGLVFVCLIVFIIADSLTNRYVATGIQSFLQWFEDNPVAGLFVFMAVYFLATVLFVPGSILTLGAGFVFANAFGLGWGVLLATVSVFTGATAGDITAFLLGRYLLRDWVQGWTVKYPIFKAIDKALETNGFRIMSLLRLSPIIPFNAVNYIAGITAISFSAYAWANIFILPGTILFCFLGATAGSLADSGASGDNSTVTIVTIVVGVVFGVLAIVVISFYAKKELNKIIAEQEEEEGNAEASETNDLESGLSEDQKDPEDSGIVRSSSVMTSTSTTAS